MQKRILNFTYLIEDFYQINSSTPFRIILFFNYCPMYLCTWLIAKMTKTIIDSVTKAALIGILKMAFMKSVHFLINLHRMKIKNELLFP